MKLEDFPIEVQRTIQGLEYALRDKMYLLARAAYALPTQNTARYTDQGTEGQLVATNAIQFAIGLGLRPALAADEKKSLEKVLPFLELLTEVVSKLTNDAIAGKDIDSEIVELRAVSVAAVDLTAANLAKLKLKFL